jgi:hypothetical protein
MSSKSSAWTATPFANAASPALARSAVPRIRQLPRLSAATVERTMRAAGSDAPARATPIVSVTAIAARSRAREGGAAFTMKSAMVAVSVVVATGIIHPLTG